MPIQPHASHPTLAALPYSQLPPAYHRRKWQVLLAYVGFYLCVYRGGLKHPPNGVRIRRI